MLVLGDRDSVADAAAAIVAGVQAAGPGVAEAIWLHVSALDRDERWNDPRFAGLGPLLRDHTLDVPLAGFDDVAAVILAGPTPRSLEDSVPPGGEAWELRRSPSRFVATAALQGVPVLGLGAMESSSVDVARPIGLRDRLHRLLTDPSAWAAASQTAVAKAQPHRLDLAEAAILGALGPGAS